jgi:alginate O-acetyltransferase complex protein AlgI
MSDLLVLPGFWLLLFVLGVVLRRHTNGFRRYFLVVVSLTLLYFCVRWETATFYAVLGLSNALLGAGLVRSHKQPGVRVAFLAGISVNVLILLCYLAWGAYFRKYFALLPSLSYLCFRGIAYLCSCYADNSISFSSGLMQMLFFPILFVGPITRVENFEREEWDYVAALERLALGLLMLIGAHLVGTFVLTDVIRTEFAASRYWVGLFANSFNFYWTFAGYSNMVIGLALLVGFKVPENFNNPYLATSITEFWRRWHMSLSFWVRDYIYIPLGGNRKGIWRKCLNLLLAMTIMGVWHGLRLNFLVWGVCHGCLLAAESLMAHFKMDVPRRILGARLEVVVKVPLTFMVVSFLWLIFRYPLPELKVYVQGLVP